MPEKADIMSFSKKTVGFFVFGDLYIYKEFFEIAISINNDRFGYLRNKEQQIIIIN